MSTVTLNFIPVRQGTKSVLVQVGDKQAWLPHSQCSIDGALLTIPEWLAVDRGLVGPESKSIDLSSISGVYSVTDSINRSSLNFRIETKPERARFCPGKTIVSLQRGCDFVGFGFVSCSSGELVYSPWKSADRILDAFWTKSFLKHIEALKAGETVRIGSKELRKIR